MSFSRAEAVADAVLNEGNVLYPYRASAMKNRMRWQFGVLGPPALAERPGADGPTMSTEVVCSGGSVRARIRFLRVAAPDDQGWRASEPESHDLDGVGEVVFEGGRATLSVTDRRVRVALECTSSYGDATAMREAVLEHSLVAVHVVLGVVDGTFVSSVDPPSEAAEAVAGCENHRLWPVLVGDDAVLACPIILYDQPELAPESIGEWGDATEIEEMLALRVMTLTDEEKAAAIATDPFSAAVVRQATPEVLETLHGRLRVGSSVTLRPKPGADAHDFFLAGRRATVVGLTSDVDGQDYVRVTVDDDPGADLHEWFGRSWFFRPDEVEP